MAAGVLIGSESGKSSDLCQIRECELGPLHPARSRSSDSDVASEESNLCIHPKSNKSQPTRPSSDDQQRERPSIPSRQVNRHQVA